MVCSVRRCSDRLGHAEVDDLRDRLIVADRHKHVRGLDIPVDDSLLVRVLHALADLHEQLEPFPCGQSMPVAVTGDWLALDVLHGEVRATLDRATCIEHLGDGGVVHQRKCLPFGLEAGNDLLAVHAGLDQLQGHSTTDRLLLLGKKDLAHATHAEVFEKTIVADALQRTGLLGGSFGRFGILGRGLVLVHAEPSLEVLT